MSLADCFDYGAAADVEVESATIYTIGYQALRPVRLFEIAKQLGATVIDCRYKPYSRVPGFDKPMLESLLKTRYECHGHHLGGFGHVTAEGIAFIRNSRRNLLLLCAEEAPGDCHRHTDICAPHFPHAIHVYRDELILTSALERALRENREYALHGLLSTHKAEGKT